ncbi:MAG: TIGR00730 family Rossman fold protein [Myxococcota bacterium]|nr:TIGR00730 family Rossman fold protein [Myxococcota bacterium]
MPSPLRRVCVFCGSNLGDRPAYEQAARAMGRSLLERDLELVFGGGHVGLMGVVADTVLEGGGRVIGVIPRALEERELAHRGLTELRVVSSMHERKAMMENLSDAFIAMPGGIGTFEEILEILTWSQLEIHPKPSGLLNVEGYYDTLIALLDQAIDGGFMPASSLDSLYSGTDSGALLEACAVHPAGRASGAPG